MSDTTPWYLKNYSRTLEKSKTHRLLGTIEKVLLQEMDEKNARRDTLHLHPSEMAKEGWCPRMSYYKIVGTETSNPESFSFQRLNVFSEGDAIHSKWQRWMQKTGLLVGNWKCQECGSTFWAKSPPHCQECYEEDCLIYAEVPIWNEEYKIMGHADGMISDSQGEALIEIKSVGLGTIRFDAPALHKAYETGEIDLNELWKRIKRPLAAHNRQIQLYMWATGVHNAIVLYEWKPTQEVREFHISLDMDVVQPMLDTAKTVLGSLEAKVPPPKPAAATNRSCQVCKFCPFKDMCWGAKS